MQVDRATAYTLGAVSEKEFCVLQHCVYASINVIHYSKLIFIDGCQEQISYTPVGVVEKTGMTETK